MKTIHSKTHRLTIQQLSDKLDIPKPTLRFWEKELDGIIIPLRTPGGQRRYNRSHISILEEIRDLRNSGKSISEIKNHFDINRNRAEPSEKTTDIELLTEKITEAVRLEVTKFFGLK